MIDETAINYLDQEIRLQINTPTPAPERLVEAAAGLLAEVRREQKASEGWERERVSNVFATIRHLLGVELPLFDVEPPPAEQLQAIIKTMARWKGEEDPARLEAGERAAVIQMLEPRGPVQPAAVRSQVTAGAKQDLPIPPAGEEVLAAHRGDCPSEFADVMNFGGLPDPPSQEVLVEGGGPAYPRPFSHDTFNEEQLPSQRGMLLRDAFAMRSPVMLADAALASGIGGDYTAVLQREYMGDGNRLMDAHATMSYRWADAMLRARKAQS